jgi:hypothetical protein
MIAARLHLFVLAAALVPGIALAQARVGVTTKADVRAAMGDPMEFQVDVLDGDVELNLVPGSPSTVDAALRKSKADPDKRPIELYDVLQYWASDKGTKKISFVFRPGDDRLLYAIIEPSPSEDTLEKAIARYGREPVIEQRVHQMGHGHIYLAAYHLVFAEEGVELVIDNRAGRVTKKILVYRDAKGRAFIPKDSTK